MKWKGELKQKPNEKLLERKKELKYEKKKLHTRQVGLKCFQYKQKKERCDRIRRKLRGRDSCTALKAAGVEETKDNEEFADFKECWSSTTEIK